MNTAIPRSSTTMVIIGVITWTVLISMTTSAPLTLATREISSDHPQVLLWLDQSVPELQNEMFEWSNNPGLTRTKRIGSLSIVNSLDVLRQRVLLELARRKALQDQRQIDANRRFLDTIGKRSVNMYNRDIAKNGIPKVKNGLEYSGRTQDWFEENEPDFREGEDDEIRRVRINLVDRFL